MVFNIISLFLCVFLSLASSEKQRWIRGGYWYSKSEFPIPDIDSTLFTHLTCAFVYINSSTYELSISSSDEPYISTFTDIVQRKTPDIFTLLSIWAGKMNATIFFSMISSADHRKKFIQSSIKTARLYGFHGLELYCVQESIEGDMGILLNEWRKAINEEAISSSKKELILTMAGYYTPTFDNNSYPIESMRENLDWVHISSYDYHVSREEKYITGAHSALYDPLSKTISTDYGIKQWVKRGLPANKIVLGLAYHGYAWTLENSKDNYINSPAKGPAITSDGSMSYKYIKYYMKSYGAASVFNATYVVNYCTIHSFWIGFDDVEAIKIKVSYAKKEGLLGYKAWQVPNDDENWVLSKAAQAEGEEPKNEYLLLKALLPTIAAICLLLGILAWCLQKKSSKFKAIVMKKLAKRKRPMSPNLQTFSFTDIKAATNNFSLENKLGEGGFGPVYKGKLLDGQEIAVKRLSEYSRQGQEEFKNEVNLTAKLQHVNLVRLLGFCSEREEKILIYEYLPNKSLDFFLYDPVRRQLLDWEKRVNIIEGVTQGLLYLQEYSRLTIIHRDLKASNILLDNEMRPKIGDFGIARSFPKNDHEASTSRIVGTYGYVPPEYVKKGIYSKKYDVYSFGVLLLQIISGKKNTCLYGPDKNLHLLEHAYELWQDGKGADFLDPLMNDKYSSCKLMRCLEVALLCVQENWEERPFMLEVYSMLKNEIEKVPTPKRPAFSKPEYIKDVKATNEIYSSNIATISQVIPR